MCQPMWVISMVLEMLFTVGSHSYYRFFVFISFGISVSWTFRRLYFNPPCLRVCPQKGLLTFLCSLWLLLCAVFPSHEQLLASRWHLLPLSSSSLLCDVLLPYILRSFPPVSPSAAVSHSYEEAAGADGQCQILVLLQSDLSGIICKHFLLWNPPDLFLLGGTYCRCYRSCIPAGMCCACLDIYAHMRVEVRGQRSALAFFFDCFAPCF